MSDCGCGCGWSLLVPANREGFWEAVGKGREEEVVGEGVCRRGEREGWEREGDVEEVEVEEGGRDWRRFRRILTRVGLDKTV